MVFQRHVSIGLNPEILCEIQYSAYGNSGVGISLILVNYVIEGEANSAQ